MKPSTLVCLTCPIGCRLEVMHKADHSLSVTGNKCPKGSEYAQEESLAPKRVVTATCRTCSPQSPRLPVKTTSPFPREHISELLERLYSLRLHPPIRAGQVVVANFGDTGIDVVAARSL